MGFDTSIIDKRALLGVVTEKLPSDSYLYPTLAPFKDVATENAIIDILQETGAEIAPYRSQDAEAELGGWGTRDQALITVMDIARKRRLNASDLRMVREAGELPVVDNSPSLVAQQGAAAARKIREAQERNKIDVDTRLEWSAISAIQGTVTYSDKVVFTVDFGVPAGQVNETPTTDWDDEDATIIQDIIDWKETVYEASGIYPTRLVISHYALLQASKNNTFINTYKEVGKFVYGAAKVREIIMQEAELNEVIVYDANYISESQAAGGAITRSQNRFLAKEKILLLPPQNIDGQPLMEMLTCPHYHNNWGTGFYSWMTEKEDPVSVEVGAGIMAFPVLYLPKAVFSATVIGND